MNTDTPTSIKASNDAQSAAPFFSVITVCLNEENSIGSTCQSIAAQTCKDYEWLVIDGGSEDATCSILKKYPQLTRLISEPDNGVYDAMNKGILLSRGRYLIFMNGGDQFAQPNALERVKQSANADIVAGEIVHQGNNSLIRPPTEITFADLSKVMLPHQSTFFRRSLFTQFGLYDRAYKIAADYEFLVRCFTDSTTSYQYISLTIANYLGNGLSEAPAHKQQHKRERHLVRWKYFPKYRWSGKSIRQIMRNLIK